LVHLTACKWELGVVDDLQVELYVEEAHAYAADAAGDARPRMSYQSGTSVYVPPVLFDRGQSGTWSCEGS
jgi:hypothetical protein